MGHRQLTAAILAVMLSMQGVVPAMAADTSGESITAGALQEEADDGMTDAVTE